MSRQKEKGTKFETALVRHARERGLDVDRSPPRGNMDKGDLTGFGKIVVEAKNHAKTKLGPWMKEAEAERENAGAHIAVIAHKRHGVGDPGEQWVTMTWSSFLAMAYAMGEVEAVK